MKRFFVTLALGLFTLAAPVVASAQDESAAEVLAKFKNEPSASDTVNAAIEYAGLNADRLESMYKRAAGSKALPKKLSYDFSMRDRDTNRPQLEETYDGTLVDENLTKTVMKSYEDLQDETQHKVHAEWELSGLVFNKEQLDVYKTMSSTAAARNKLMKEVTDLYFKRRTLQVQLTMDSEMDVMSRLQLELQIQQFTAELDGRTGGWFSKELKSRK